VALDGLKRVAMSVSGHGSFGDYWKATRERLDAEFERRLPLFFDRQPAPVVAAIREVLAGGKRLRGCLVCLLCDALGGGPAAAFPRAMAVECVQAASLIHDDLIDGDTVRRHRAATWTLQGPRRAVLLGDLIFATALHRMAELGPEDALALGQAIATMATGAYQEPLEPPDPKQDPVVDTGNLYPHCSISSPASCSVPRRAWGPWPPEHPRRSLSARSNMAPGRARPTRSPTTCRTWSGWRWMEHRRPCSCPSSLQPSGISVAT
jgi:hypothetical protein